ncbi:AMP-binding protein [Bradyrhizobium sp. CB3481]|nr:AMP-binding protein [Bradyrhizobium sp. CB3481]WFU14438.1 AMP-binding protein [Bradyrhizobium sp. CB3481]
MDLDDRSRCAPASRRSLQSVLAEATPTNELEPRPLDAPMQMLFTSGTTGHPKAILAPHGRFAFAASLGESIGYRSGDRLYTGLSLTHANAQFSTLGNSLRGQLPGVFSKQFTKSRLWEIVACYGCTTFNLLGGMTIAIFAEPPGRSDGAHNVRFVLSAGMPASMWRAFEERFGVAIFEFFGTAEGGLTLNPPGIGPVGSIGKALSGTVCEILDEAMRPVPAGELGEICFRNADGTVPPVNYFGAKEASEQKTRGGWFHSGDIGWKDEAGWLYFSHRAGYSIRRNGDFIDPRAIETVIATIPDVDDVLSMVSRRR